MSEDVLSHHGIEGQRWGHKNGPPYPLKESQKSKREKLFVSGSSKTQDRNSGYYRSKLPKGVRKELKEAIRNKESILVGDAPGVDRQVQNFLRKYKDVVVYGSGKELRYKANKKWQQKLIDASEYEPGSKEWLAKKDVAMTNDATKGLAVVLDEGAKATRKNVQRLIDQNKDVKVYELSKHGPKHDKWW